MTSPRFLMELTELKIVWPLFGPREWFVFLYFLPDSSLLYFLSYSFSLLNILSHPRLLQTESGLLTPQKFVEVTSTNAAKIFNVYPQKVCVSKKKKKKQKTKNKNQKSKIKKIKKSKIKKKNTQNDLKTNKFKPGFHFCWS